MEKHLKESCKLIQFWWNSPPCSTHFLLWEKERNAGPRVISLIFILLESCSSCLRDHGEFAGLSLCLLLQLMSFILCDFIIVSLYFVSLSNERPSLTFLFFPFSLTTSSNVLELSILPHPNSFPEDLQVTQVEAVFTQ